MWRKLQRLVIPCIFVFALLSVGVSCALPVKGDLTPVEINEYEGEKLSSVNDFRENSILGPQYVDVEQYRLKISGLVSNPREYTYNEAITSYKSYDKVVSLNCVEGWSVKILWGGVLVKDLLAAAEPLPSAKVVIFHAYDGYTTSLPVDYVIDNDILMAYKMNDVILPPERGFPFNWWQKVNGNTNGLSG